MRDLWRVGRSFGIHVYRGDEPVATFHRAEDAAQAVADRAAVEAVTKICDEWATAGMVAPLYESPVEVAEIVRAALAGAEQEAGTG